MSIVWFNGNFLDESAASISIRDAGLLHAAGVFTTMRSYAQSGRVFRLAQQWRPSGTVIVPVQRCWWVRG